jgi:hypothetical protein
MNRTTLLLITGLMLVSVPAADLAWAQKPSQSSTGKPRVEKDLLGEKEIPADVYYGVQTARALRISSSQVLRSINTPGSSRRGHWSNWHMIH